MGLILGAHVSMTGGLLGAAKEAKSYDADTFMIYTGAPQNTKRKPIEEMKVSEGQLFMEENNLSHLVIHAPYIINLASHKPDLYALAISFFSEEIRRTHALGADRIVIHPGSFTETTVDYGISRIADALNQILTPETQPIICLETMAGKGSEVGRTFDELAQIIEKVELKDKIGICFDTCHTHDGGYDIIHDFQSVLDTFDRTIGLDRIQVFHINGSLNPKGAHKDRHANIGAGADSVKGLDYIGLDAIRRIVHHPVCQNKPLILETPWLDGKTNLYKEEIALLRTPF